LILVKLAVSYQIKETISRHRQIILIALALGAIASYALPMNHFLPGAQAQGGGSGGSGGSGGKGGSANVVT